MGTGGTLGPGDHLLSTRQLDRNGLERIFELARLLQPVSRGERKTSVLAGAVLGNLFFEPSTRSRISFGSAFCRLGGSVLDSTGIGMTSLAKGESLEDTARVVSGYVDAIVLRHPAAGAARVFAAAARVPVINGGDGDGEHPTQSLTDIFTMQAELAERDKRIDGSKIAIIGDLRFGRTVHSLIIALSGFERLSLALLAPPGLELPSDYVDYASSRGHDIMAVRTIDEALDGAAVIYMTRYQTERYGSELTAPPQTADLHLTAAVIRRHARSDPVILHPLPRDSSVGELATDLDHFSNLAIFRQTDNGVPVRMALFCALFGIGAAEVEASLQDVGWPLRRRKI